MTNLQKGIACVITGAVIGFVASVAMHSGSNLSGIYKNVVPQNAPGTKSGDLVETTVAKTLPAGSNSVLLYTNNSGRDVMADFAAITIPTGQTSSTTYQMNVFATTSTSIPATQDYTALAEGRRFLINVLVATSSTATTTNSIFAASTGKGNGAVLVASGSSIFGYIQNLALGGGGPVCTGSVCETATSSNRGTNPIVNVHLRTLTSDATGL